MDRACYFSVYQTETSYIYAVDISMDNISFGKTYTFQKVEFDLLQLFVVSQFEEYPTLSIGMY